MDENESDDRQAEMSGDSYGNADLRIRVLKEDGNTEDRQLRIGSDGVCRFALASVPGADAVHFAVTDSLDRVFRCEIPAQQKHPVHVKLSPDGNGGWTVESDHKPVLVLNEEAAPLPVIPTPPAVAQGRTPPGSGWLDDREVAPASGTPWEVAIIIDGTAWSWSKSLPLVTDDDFWPELCRKLTALLVALDQETESLLFTLVAYGDHTIEGVTADDLAPTYLLRVPAAGHRGRMAKPTDRRQTFQAFQPDLAESLLTAIEPTAGGDFVDALADALALCNCLPWSRDTRKLVLVFGDSPGHSITHPIGHWGDATIRICDLDLEVDDLHRKGVEILTLYNRPPQDAVPRAGHGRELLQHTAEQYRRLASTPDYALDAAAFDHTEVARRLITRNYPIGRGAGYARLLAP